MKTNIPLEVFRARQITIHPKGGSDHYPRIKAVLSIQDNDNANMNHADKVTCYLVYKQAEVIMTDTLVEALESYGEFMNRFVVEDKK